MMHPGHQNPDYVGPSGPTDPWLSVLKVDSIDGQPISLLANFSMHYFAGHAGVSADYFGRFAAELAKRLAPDDRDFVGIMSQGTSGDLWWGDYSVPKSEKPFNDIEQFTKGLVDKTFEACRDIEMRADARLAMAERRMTLGRRLPDEGRLAWARRKLKLMGDERPRDRPEVYAQQAVYLQENPTVTVPIQAIRIGELGITTLPNEVYAITGLKLKAQSPLPLTFNLSLANGASGYIPPPEQHALGGYTTWPARTAGLEKEAEPKIVAALLELLEEVSGENRKPASEKMSRYSKSVNATNPVGYWRMGDLHGPELENLKPTGRLTAKGDVAYHLPGPSRDGYGHEHESRAIQLAGGKLLLDGVDLNGDFSVVFHFLVGTPMDFRGTTATLVEFGGQRLTITGSDHGPPGRLMLAGSVGTSTLETNVWYRMVMRRSGDLLSVYLGSNAEPVVSAKLTDVSAKPTDSVRSLTIGGDQSDASNLEGRIDELAIYDETADLSKLLSLTERP